MAERNGVLIAMTSNYHLAQLNIARMLQPLDHPQLAGFVAKLDEINALADAAEGFVWRLQDEDGDATSIRPFPDEMLIVNMSVWESVEALFDYTYRTAHAKVMSQRKQWFEMMGDSHMVLWWVPAGDIPSVDEAKQKLELLQRQGPTADAFTFKERFSAPDV